MYLTESVNYRTLAKPVHQTDVRYKICTGVVEGKSGKWLVVVAVVVVMVLVVIIKLVVIFVVNVPVVVRADR